MFDLKEFIFDESVNGFDIGLVSIHTRWNGVMGQSFTLWEKLNIYVSIVE